MSKNKQLFSLVHVTLEVYHTLLGFTTYTFPVNNNEFIISFIISCSLLLVLVVVNESVSFESCNHYCNECTITFTV